MLSQDRITLSHPPTWRQASLALLIVFVFISYQPCGRAKEQPRWRSSLRTDLKSGGADTSTKGPGITSSMRAAMHAGFIPDFAKATNRRAGKAAPFGGVKPGADDGHIQDSLVYPTCYNITCGSPGKMKPPT